MKDIRPERIDPSPKLPREITYESVPGRFGLWTATIETPAGRISVTGHSLQNTRDALETQLRQRSQGARDEGMGH